ncbi:hypothetical protein HHK36_014994 [Tetracentron sinense]|uniref:K Homology domain-containing protein n=1 Tax=Tetracentron sinense TaxID=13715 RepID=A0A834YZZ5_TETSI|nr:hypothetical protein HHK36_014994 [Tetracentron sinense]
MDRNKRFPFKKHSHSQFKKKGGNKKGKWNNFSHEQNAGNPHAADTVYRILCAAPKIGSVIGKGGTIINALRDETRAKIRVGESVPGTDERVVFISSSPTRKPRMYNTNEDPENDVTEKELELMQPHCPAQDALLKVHERIAEEDDLYGGMTYEDNNENNVVSARLLVPNNQVGCLIGKGGNIIQKLRTETGANIRILPAEHLPACAMSTDELVQVIVELRFLYDFDSVGVFIVFLGFKLNKQLNASILKFSDDLLGTSELLDSLCIESTFQISGTSAVAKRALYEVSTLLHQNPRKDNPLNYPIPAGGQGFYPPGPPMANMLPPGNPMWSHRNSGAHGAPPMPWVGGYGNHSSGFVPGGFSGIPAGNGGEASGEFSMKIVCSAEKIGGVIGKGGCNVKQLQQETGANIHVEDTTPESDERVILVSSFEALWNPRSQTIEAILQLQSKTSEISEKGIITTRLLVPSNKVGCLLGQGGHVITEMRRRTQADIRVYSQEDKPNCASAEEELVQISGNFRVANTALSEIASRLRARCLRDANGGVEPTPVGPFQGFGPSGRFPGRGPPPSGVIGAGGPGGYEQVKSSITDYGKPTFGYVFSRRAYKGQPIVCIFLSRMENPLAALFEISIRITSSLLGPIDVATTGRWNCGRRYWQRQGGHEYEAQSYPVQPTATGYPNVNSSMEVKIPNSAVGSVIGTGGSNISNIGEVSGARVKLQDPQSGGSECVVEIHGSSEQMKAAQSLLQSFISSSVQNFNAQQGSYQY